MKGKCTPSKICYLEELGQIDVNYNIIRVSADQDLTSEQCLQVVFKQFYTLDTLKQVKSGVDFTYFVNARVYCATMK